MVMLVDAASWVPSAEIILEPNAEAAVRSNFNAVVVAGPGAGNGKHGDRDVVFKKET